MGTDHVVSLSSGRSSSESIITTAPSSPGTYYYGACIAGGTCTSGEMVIVSVPPPQLKWRRIRISDSTPSERQDITLSITVHNVGGGSTPETTVRYYFSKNDRITISDTLLGTARVTPLASGRNRTVSLMTMAPVIDNTIVCAPICSSDDIYYYGVCIEGGVCTSGIRVVVSPLPPKLEWDISVSNSTPIAGQDFLLSVTARNTGGGQTQSIALYYRRSTNDIISPSDSWLGLGFSDVIFPLSWGDAPTTRNIRITAPSSAGTYYYGGCPSVGPAEYCTPGVRVVVSPRPPPKVELSNFRVSDSTSFSGQEITLSVTARNVGGETADRTDIHYYGSTNNIISPSDTFLGTGRVDFLSSGDSRTNGGEITVPLSAGTYYYGACLDSGDCTPGVRVVVSVP